MITFWDAVPDDFDDDEARVILGAALTEFFALVRISEAFERGYDYAHRLHR